MPRKYSCTHTPPPTPWIAASWSWNCSVSFSILNRSGIRFGPVLFQTICFKVVLSRTAIMTGYFSVILNSVCPHSHHLWHRQSRFVHSTVSHWMYSLFLVPFFVNPINSCRWKSQLISSSWKTQTSKSDTNNHGMFNDHFKTLSFLVWFSVCASAKCFHQI